MEINPEIMAYAISLILGVLAIVLGDKYGKVKQKFADTQQITIKLSAALKATSDAIEDDKITHQEQKAIVEHWRDLIDEAKNLLK